MSFPRLARLPLLMVLALPLMTAACGVPIALTAASYGADGVLLATTQKTGADHLVSMASKKDCAIWRTFRNIPICKDREAGVGDPYDVDYNTPDRVVSEAGVQYLSSPRAPANAPASSWDAAAYKPAPTGPTQPTEPVTAVAEAAPPPAVEAAPQPAASAKPVTPSHPKKATRAAKAKPVKAPKAKPASQDQAASRL